jgi:hypothetical protein
LSDDKRVTDRSDAEVRRIAERAKAEYSASDQRPVDVLKILSSDSVPTIYGRKSLIFVVADDAELGKADGKTEYSKGVVTVTVRQSIYDQAKQCVPRARMTLAHELAHAVMHHTAPFLRVVGAAAVADDTIPSRRPLEFENRRNENMPRNDSRPNRGLGGGILVAIYYFYSKHDLLSA